MPPTPISARNYSSTALPTQVSTNIDNQLTTTNIPVASTAGYPAPPFTGCFERNTQNQEFVLCTAVPDGNHFTVVRAYDGTSPVAHLALTSFEHCVGAIDYREANWHHTDNTRDDHPQYARTDGARAITGLQSFTTGISTSSIAGGPVTFANIPLGPNADPTTANQLSRKSYVDAKASAAQSAAITSAVATSEAYTNANSFQWINNNAINLIQGGPVNVATDSGGNFTVTYGVAFPTATNALVVCDGSSAQHTMWHVQISSTSRTGFAGRIAATNADTQAPQGTYTIQFIAIGH